MTSLACLQWDYTFPFTEQAMRSSFELASKKEQQ